MSDKIDARGLSCPQPVVLTQKQLRTENLILKYLWTQRFPEKMFCAV